MRRNGRLGRILTNAVCCTGAEPCSEWKGHWGRPPRPWAPRNRVLALPNYWSFLYRFLQMSLL